MGRIYKNHFLSLATFSLGIAGCGAAYAVEPCKFPLKVVVKNVDFKDHFRQYTVKIQVFPRDWIEPASVHGQIFGIPKCQTQTVGIPFARGKNLSGELYHYEKKSGSDGPCEVIRELKASPSAMPLIPGPLYLSKISGAFYDQWKSRIYTCRVKGGFKEAPISSLMVEIRKGLNNSPPKCTIYALKA